MSELLRLLCTAQPQGHLAQRDGTACIATSSCDSRSRVMAGLVRAVTDGPPSMPSSTVVGSVCWDGCSWHAWPASRHDEQPSGLRTRRCCCALRICPTACVDMLSPCTASSCRGLATVGYCCSALLIVPERGDSAWAFCAAAALQFVHRMLLCHGSVDWSPLFGRMPYGTCLAGSYHTAEPAIVMPCTISYQCCSQAFNPLAALRFVARAAVSVHSRPGRKHSKWCSMALQDWS